MKHFALSALRRLRPSAPILCVALLLVVLAGGISRAQADGGDSLTFAETHKTIRGAFLTFWRTQGGLDAFGYPISDPDYRLDPKTGQRRLVQWFERSRFELTSPDTQNGTVELGLVGTELRDAAMQNDPDFQPAAPVTDPKAAPDTLRFFTETKHNMHGRFYDYWKHNNGAVRFGLPISEEHRETDPDTGATYVVQWFERARMEYHPEKTPPNDVLLGLLGTELFTPTQQIAYEWKAGQPGTFLADPNAIYVATDGSIYVNDRASGRVNKYNARHSLTNFWYMDNGSQSIAGPVQNTASGQDNTTPILYQIGLYKQVVHELMPDQTWQTVALADSGDPDSQTPNQALAVDNNGNIFVLKYASNSAHLVWEYDKQGLFLGSFIKRDAVSDPVGFTVSDGTVYIADGASGRYRVFSVGDTNTTDARSGAQGYALPAQNGLQPGVVAIAPGPRKTLLVAAPGSIYSFDSIGGTGRVFGARGSGPGQFLVPSAVTADGQGNIYVADPDNHQISIFDSLGRYQDSIQDSPLNRDAALVSATAVAATSGTNNRVIVADPVNRRMTVFTALGAYERAWSTEKIAALALDPDGAIFALNKATGMVIKYDLSGKEGGRWGGIGTEPGRFRLPSAIAISKDKKVFVADTGNQRIQELNEDGTPVKTWGTKGDGVAQFGGTGLNDVYDGPTSLAIEPASGTLYVTDPALGRVLKFSLDGQPLGALANPDPARPFTPVAVAAVPPDLPTNGPNVGAAAVVNGIYVLCADSLYKLDTRDSITARLSVSAMGQGLETAETGDGSVSSLTAFAVDGNGGLFATDSEGRLQKFRVQPSQTR